MDRYRANEQRLIKSDMLENLPEPVQRYMAYTGVVGNPWIDTVRLKQVGRFRQGLDRPWMSVTAEEFYTTNPPTLIWNARFRVAGPPQTLQPSSGMLDLESQVFRFCAPGISTNLDKVICLANWRASSQSST
jgi:hypothetical protein